MNMNPLQPSANQLASAYATNPQGLQQAAQQHTVPGAGTGQQPVPAPTYLDAIAMQQVQQQAAEIAKQLAQKAQQPPGGIPTVFDATKQQAAQLTAQNMAAQQPQPQEAPQPQGIASMATGGPVRGGIDRIPSNLRMAGGGIIAFSSGTGDKAIGVPDEVDNHISGMETGSRYADAIRKAQGGDDEDGGGLSGLLQHILGWAHAGGDTPDNRQAAARLLRQAGTPVTQMPASVSPKAEPTKTEATEDHSGGSGGGRAGASVRGPAKAPSEDDDMGLKAYLRGALKVDSNAARDADAAYYDKTSGIKAVLEARQNEIDERKALMDKDVGERPKAWGSASLDAMLKGILGSGNDGRAGAGLMQLAAGANNMDNVRAGYNKEDLANNADINKLREAMLTAQLDNGQKIADAGLKGRDVAERTKLGAATNAASVVNTEEMARARIEQASMHYAELAQRAKEHGDNKTLQQLAQIQNNTRAQATARAKADGLNLDEGALAAKAEHIYADMLLGNALYKKLSADYGVPITKTPAAGGTVLNFDIKGKRI
jgi:hypothetical protein